MQLPLLTATLLLSSALGVAATPVPEENVSGDVPECNESRYEWFHGVEDHRTLVSACYWFVCTPMNRWRLVRNCGDTSRCNRDVPTGCIDAGGLPY